MKVYRGGRRTAPVILNRNTTRQLNVPAAITRYQLGMRLGWTFRRYRTIQGCLFEPEVALWCRRDLSAPVLGPDLELSL